MNSAQSPAQPVVGRKQDVVEFSWKGITFLVKRDEDKRIVYRDKLHLGGPWSQAAATVGNASYDREFRKRLNAAKEFVK